MTSLHVSVNHAISDHLMAAKPMAIHAIDSDHYLLHFERARKKQPSTPSDFPINPSQWNRMNRTKKKPSHHHVCMIIKPSRNIIIIRAVFETAHTLLMSMLSLVTSARCATSSQRINSQASSKRRRPARINSIIVVRNQHHHCRHRIVNIDERNINATHHRDVVVENHQRASNAARR